MTTNMQKALRLAEEIEKDWISCEPAKALVALLQLELLRLADLQATLKNHVATSHDARIDARYLLRIIESDAL